MLSVRFDVNGTYHIRWPEKDREIISLGSSVLQYDATLPEAERLPSDLRSQIQTFTEQASESASSASQSESSRAESAGSFDATLKAAIPRGSIAIDRLKGQYAENLAQLEHWGVPTKKTKSGKVSVSRPELELEWVAFFSAYVQKESEVPADLQVRDPSFEEMAKYASDLRTSYDARQKSRGQREIGVSTRSTASSALLVRLQCAAVYLAAVRNGGVVTKDLKNWSFTVIEAVGSSAEAIPTTPESGPPATSG